MDRTRVSPEGHLSCDSGLRGCEALGGKAAANAVITLSATWSCSSPASAGYTEEPKAESRDITGASVGTGLRFPVGVCGLAHLEHREASSVADHRLACLSQAHVGGLDAFRSECCRPVAAEELRADGGLPGQLGTHHPCVDPGQHPGPAHLP